MEKKFSGKNILVLGLGISGRAAVNFLLRRGAHVAAADRHAKELIRDPAIAPLMRRGLEVIPDNQIPQIQRFDLCVVSPGVPPDHPIYSAFKSAEIPILGEIELACGALRQRAVAITGTNGKTTTALLTAHALNFSGKPARALGNIGVPLTQAVDEAEPSDILVVELSSWQLETLTTPVFEAAAILNITPNHLDRHKTMEAYAQAKFRVGTCLKKGAPLFVGHQAARDFPALLAAMPSETYGFEETDTLRCDRTTLYLRGKVLFELPEPYRGKRNHDVENIMAAYALCSRLGVSDQSFVESLQSFKKPAHRVEFVRSLNGVAYYDDSKGTNLAAVVKAVDTMDGGTILIAGGMHKGASYLPWAESFTGKVRAIYAIGEAAPQISAELNKFLPVKPCATLEEAVRFAAETAEKGENVLLSPGCSSYDMFRDYNHRGDEFKRIVHALQSEVNAK